MGSGHDDHGEAPTHRLFLSYRRSDDTHFVGRLHDHLCERFGDTAVFRDIDSLLGGAPFREVIEHRLADVDAVVAVIGATWKDRIRNEGDFVRLEIAEALHRQCPVVPVLIEDTELPGPTELPPDLQPLLDLNALRIRRDPDFRRDTARVIESVVVAAEIGADRRRSRPGAASTTAPAAPSDTDEWLASEGFREAGVVAPPARQPTPDRRPPAPTRRPTPGVLVAGAAGIVVLALLIALLVSRQGDGGGGAAATTAPTVLPTSVAPADPASSAPSAATGPTSAGSVEPLGRRGALTGMKGTLSQSRLDSDFTTRLRSSYTGSVELTSFDFAAETYDAATVIALAVVKAGTDGIDYAREIVGITRGGTSCRSFAECRTVIEAGGDPDYDGVSGTVELGGPGEPTLATYSVVQFGANDRLDPNLTEYEPVAAPATVTDLAAAPPTGTRAGDGVLKLGALLPRTGDIAFVGPAEFAAFDLAIADINAAGGVLGRPVVGVKGDSGDTSTDLARDSTEDLLAQGVDAIVGATSSDVSLSVIDRITGAGVVLFSPANTRAVLSTRGDNGLYFRLSPSNLVQGTALAQVVARAGARRVAVLVQDDVESLAVADGLVKTLQENGVRVAVRRTYALDATVYDADVAAVAAASPDAIALIGSRESSRVLRALVDAGIGPSALPTYGWDGNMGDDVAEAFEAGT